MFATIISTAFTVLLITACILWIALVIAKIYVDSCDAIKYRALIKAFAEIKITPTSTKD
jgi:hypothetical protein